MKKQIRFIGWLYECEVKTTFKWYYNLLEYDEARPIGKILKSFEDDSCKCGKHCKLVKVELILRRKKK